MSEQDVLAEIEVDIARTLPRLTPAALASFCAFARASDTRSDMLHVCDCCNCGETCVPLTANDNFRPLFFCAMFCCKLVSEAAVALVCKIATGRVNDQSTVGVGA